MRMLSLLLTLVLFACTPGDDLPDLAPLAGTEYRLAPGDAVRLIVFGEENMTGDFRINESGLIAVPLLGTVPAKGLSIRELEGAIASGLSRAGLLHNPSVTAEITAYRPIFVLGEVNKPGQYTYLPGMTVVTAAAVAGGFTYRAVSDYAAVIRASDGEARESKANRQAFVQPGDVITFFERRF